MTKQSIQTAKPEKSWEILGYGWDRLVVRVDKIVIKFPLHSQGEDCNYDEALNWFSFGGECVPTHIMTIAGLVCAVQPYLTPSSLENIPEWATKYDGCQGGLNAKGKYQIYDFADPHMSMASKMLAV